MEINEKKKLLYKEKPIASVIQESSTGYIYNAKLSNNIEASFTVEFSEMGENIFPKEIDAQLLIRWINP